MDSENCRKYLVIANPATGKKQRLHKILRELQQVLNAGSHLHILHFTEKSLNGTVLVKQRLNKSFTDIIAIGGDGTINEVINGFDDERIIFSFIPNGSGNDFAKNFHFKSLEHEVQNAVEGPVYKMDLGICNKRKFINGVGIGLDGQVIYDLLIKKNILSGAQKYYYHVLRNLISYKSQPFDYRIEETDYKRKLLLLCIGNGTTFGNGFRLTPLADMFDGYLDVCEIGNLNVWKRVIHVGKLVRGLHDELNEVQFHQAKAVVVRRNHLLHAHIDGEYMGNAPYDIKVLPKGLPIRLPKLIRYHGFLSQSQTIAH